MTAFASALDIEVPEAETLVAPLRQRYDPSAAEGMPAHITLLYPFLPAERIDERVLADLRRCFTGFAPFRFELVATRRFGAEVLYLAPEPAEPFRRLTQAIWQQFPATPPFGGRHADIVPHLTVANLADPTMFEQVAAEFDLASEGRLPIAASATEVALMDNRIGHWQALTTFPLGGG